MKTIEWKLTKKQKANIFREDRDLLVEGSAGSGKTQYACTKVITYCLQYRRAKAYVFRQTLKACKETCREEIRELLEVNKIPHKENKAENKIRFLNGSVITFMGLDEKTKIRSINADIIYVEQAEETKKTSLGELKARIRAKTSQKYYGQLILVATPEEETHWIYNEFHREKRGTVLHFHYKENPYLPKEYVEYLESLEEIDEELYLQLTEGLWGKLTDIIFTKWDTKISRKTFDYYTGGTDFGFNNPSCFLLIGWYDGEPYVLDEVYKTRLINSELIDETKVMLNRNGLKPSDLDTVWQDSAEPARIAEFEKAGFNAKPADKSVNTGIDTVKSVKVHIKEHCLHTKKEIKSYKWKKDRDGNPTDEPVKINNHAMDALRYGVHSEIGTLINTIKDIVPAIEEINL